MKEDINKKKLEEALKKTPFNDYSIEEVNDGVSTNVFKLINSETYYLKILSDKNWLSAIVLVNRLLLEQNINIPEIEYVLEESSLLDNKGFYIEKELKGKTVKDDPTLSKEQLDSIIIEAGKDLANINSIMVKGVGWMEGVKEEELYSRGKDYNDFIVRNVPNMLKHLRHVKILSRKQIRKINRYIIKHQYLLDTKDTSYLAHGDFCTEHIYHINGKYSGIIDFGDIRGTSKYHDLAHFYLYNREHFKSLVEGYNSIYKLPNNYMDKVIVEAVIFGVGKLWWVSKNNPKKLINHSALNLFEEVIY